MSNTQEIVRNIQNNTEFRTTLCQKSHYWFLHTYLPHYMKYPMAEIHREMISMTEQNDAKHVFISTFKGSGKSTFFGLSFPLWALLGSRQKKHLLIVAKNQKIIRYQQKRLLEELENNHMLRKDFFPKTKHPFLHQKNQIMLPLINAKIEWIPLWEDVEHLLQSSQKPDLVICDELEDASVTKNVEKQVQTRQWIQNKLLHTGDIDCQYFFVGNYLHRRLFIPRCIEAVKHRKIAGMAFIQGALNKKRKSNWPQKYKDFDALCDMTDTKDLTLWTRDYLHVSHPLGNLLLDESITYHKNICPMYRKNHAQGKFYGNYVLDSQNFALVPQKENQYGENQNMVFLSAKIHQIQKDRRIIHIDPLIYDLPCSIDEVIPGHIQNIKKIETTVAKHHKKMVFNTEELKREIIIEDTPINREKTAPLYQKHNVHVCYTDCSNNSLDTLLKTIIPSIKQGLIKFPEIGCEALIHDLYDYPYIEDTSRLEAFALLISHLMILPPSVAIQYKKNNDESFRNPFLPSHEENEQALLWDLWYGPKSEKEFRKQAPKDMSEKEIQDFLHLQNIVYSQGELGELYQYKLRTGHYALPFHKRPPIGRGREFLENARRGLKAQKKRKKVKNRRKKR